MKECEIVLSKITYERLVDDDNPDKGKIVHFLLLNPQLYRLITKQLKIQLPSNVRIKLR